MSVLNRRPTRAVVVVGLGLALVVSLAACASKTVATASGPTHSAHPSASAASTAPVTLASKEAEWAAAEKTNRAAAAAEGAKLLAMVQLPAGAATRPAGSSPISGPLSVTSTPDKVDTALQWSLPLTWDAATTWVKAQHPDGLTYSGIGSEEGHLVSLMFDLSLRTSQLNGAEIDLTIVPATSSTTLFRADAVVEWLDPRPLPVVNAGSRLRLEVGAACPADPGVPSNSGDDLHWQLVPDAEPSEAMICSYSGLGPTHRPTRRMLDVAAVTTLARLARAVSLVNSGDVVYPCPSGMPARALIAFRYIGRADVDLLVTSSVCGGASNGVVHTSASLGLPEFEAAVAAAAG